VVFYEIVPPSSRADETAIAIDAAKLEKKHCSSKLFQKKKEFLPSFCVGVSRFLSKFARRKNNKHY